MEEGHSEYWSLNKNTKYTFQSVPFSEIGIKQISRLQGINAKKLQDTQNHPQKAKKKSIPKSTDLDLATFHYEMSQRQGKQFSVNDGRI